MPNIDSINPVLYTGDMPYHVDYDNLPLIRILARQDLINLAVDQYTAILKDAIGSAGSLSNRLSQSIHDNGDLKTVAINDALHNIGYHSDGQYSGIEYVRMKLDERNKLETIEEDANLLKLQVDNNLIDNGTVQLIDSDTVTWVYESSNKIKAEFAFPTSAAHQHYSGLTPVHSNIITPDYKNYKSTSLSTPYIDGSLKVYINGIRIFSDIDVYVYSSGSPSGTWYATKFTPNYSAGTFVLSRTIASSDVIKIDFDISLT